MDISLLSKKYAVRKISNSHIFDVLELCLGNPQPQAFWEKNHFQSTGTESVQENYTVVIMEREL